MADTIMTLQLQVEFISKQSYSALYAYKAGNTLVISKSLPIPMAKVTSPKNNDNILIIIIIIMPSSDSGFLYIVKHTPCDCGFEFFNNTQHIDYVIHFMW